MVIKGFPFRFFKWTRFFKPGLESPIVPVWVSFPNLPVSLFHGNFFRSVAGVVGKVLRVDGATSGYTRTVVARACVEVDLLFDLPDRIWIGCRSSGLFQKVVFERLPSFCVECCKLGHVRENCRKRPGVDTVLPKKSEAKGKDLPCNPVNDGEALSCEGGVNVFDDPGEEVVTPCVNKGKEP
ncbi:uncharacterized protein LOC122668503 [Telopea speciosissima]|uniref:uncharacterized protein LOC122668503 n=1 Tax=Telopea speciosissima TaxID=54955 RepID=UPI001CC6293F|nr:uncharacterized protein LOC122668503 [Telopea speciosissima]